MSFAVSTGGIKMKITSKYHTRVAYERFYKNICKQSGLDFPADLHVYSHVDLMMAINYALRVNHCQQFDIDEVMHIINAFK